MSTSKPIPISRFAAAVAAIGDVVDPNTRTIKVRAWVDNAYHKLKPEMFARLHMDISEGKAFLRFPRRRSLKSMEKISSTSSIRGITIDAAK